MSSPRKVALVTGAGGSIGTAIVKRLHQDGASVVAVDIDQERLATLKRSLPDIQTFGADLSKSTEADAVLVAAGGRVDILLNNAGISDGGGAIDELDDTVWERVIAVNLSAAFYLARRVIGGMLAAKGGVIVNMSSVAGLRGGRTGVAYTASKWALVGMAQNIAASLGPEGIRAYAICPGVVSGQAVQGLMPPTRRSVLNRGRDQKQPPPVAPEEVADLVAFLVSDASRHINGVAIPIDSGWLAY